MQCMGIYDIKLLTWNTKLLEGSGLEVILGSLNSIKESELESNIYILFTGFSSVIRGKDNYS